jgi:uncharacterized protein YhbP (UPF0306 family)
MNLIVPPHVADYLAARNVMTLATQGPAGPWAAAVFYACEGSSLVFLSSPESRHCRNLAQDARCAATIQEDCSDWAGIKGIQLEGRVLELDGEERERAQSLYGGKFPIAASLATMPPAIFEAMARVHWYRLLPERLRFIDNSKGFGHREEFAPG